MNYNERGKIENRNIARQIIDFSGIQYGKITPTDIDGLIEYHDKAIVLLEFKYADAELPRGQRVALERMCDCFRRANKEATVLVCEHFVKDCTKDIIARNAIVREVYYKGNWYNDGKSTVKERVDRFIQFVDHNWLD